MVVAPHKVSAMKVELSRLSPFFVVDCHKKWSRVYYGLTRLFSFVKKFGPP